MHRYSHPNELKGKALPLFRLGYFNKHSDLDLEDMEKMTRRGEEFMVGPPDDSDFFAVTADAVRYAHKRMEAPEVPPSPGPSKVVRELRKENQTLRKRLQELHETHEASLKTAGTLRDALEGCLKRRQRFRDLENWDDTPIPPSQKDLPKAPPKRRRRGG